MKTLGKLKINSEKMLKNEELVNLKGGYGGAESHFARCGNSWHECIFPINDCAKVNQECTDHCDSQWVWAICV